MPKEQLRIETSDGFSLVEIVLATAVFALIATGLAGTYLYGEEATASAGNRARAVFLADEGLEAVRNMRDAGFSNLSDGTHGLAILGNKWVFSGSNDITDIFTRRIIIVSADTDRKNITSQVTWQQNPQRTGAIEVVTRMTNWQSNASPQALCNDHAVQNGFSAGTCRQNAVQCGLNSEVYLPTGDPFCAGSPSTNTCCALP